MKLKFIFLLAFLSISFIACEKEELVLNELGTAVPLQINLNQCRFQASNVSTITGSDPGYVDGPLDGAFFNNPRAIAHDHERNITYVAEWSNHVIRAIKNDKVYTFVGGLAGDQEGYGTKARLKNPTDIVLDKNGTLFVADYGNHKIRRITPDGNMTTFVGGDVLGDADGFGSNALFNLPHSLTIDKQGTLFVTDMGNAKIKRIKSNGEVKTIAGSSHGFTDSENPESAQFFYPRGLTLGPDDNLYIADYSNHKIRKVNRYTGATTTLTGCNAGKRDDHISRATFKYPADVIFDHLGNLLVLDTNNHSIRIIANNRVSTLMGNDAGEIDGSAETAQFRSPKGFTIINREIYVADSNNDRIRKVTMRYACN